MATQLQLRRGTTAENDIFLGAEGEITVDTSIWTIRLHDSITTGGHELALADLSNVFIGKTLTPRFSSTYDLGTPQLKFRDVYISNSLHLGDIKLYKVDDQVKVETPTQSFFLGEQKSNYEIVDNIQARDSYPTNKRFAGMLILTKDKNYMWQLKNDLVTWIPYAANYRRTTIEHTIDVVPALNYVDFTLDIGNSVLVYNVEVTHAITLEVFDTETRDQSNPYTFISTEDHLVDDGSSLLSDGSVFRGRRYYIWSCSDDSNTIYCRVSNTDVFDVVDFKISITYVPIEISISL